MYVTEAKINKDNLISSFIYIYLKKENLYSKVGDFSFIQLGQ